MILPADKLPLVARGKLTCLIVPADEGRKYRLGESYAVQSWRPRGTPGPPVVSGEKCRIRVTQKWQHLLADSTEEDARAAGWGGLQEFFAYWRGKYGTGPLVEQAVATVVFELDHVVRGRFLGPHGYTSSPAFALGATTDRVSRRDPPEPEAVSESEQRELTRRQRLVWNEGAALRRSQREADQRKRQQGVRLEEAKQKARLQAVDVSTDVRVIEGRIQRIERKVDLDESNGDDAEAA